MVPSVRAKQRPLSSNAEVADRCNINLVHRYEDRFDVCCPVLGGRPGRHALFGDTHALVSVRFLQ